MPSKGLSCGIYAIRRTATADCYVGQSVRMEKRWREHIKALQQGKHHSRYLQRAFDKYGESAFQFEVLDYIADRDCLTSAEQRWMDALKPSFNSAPAAGSIAGVKFSDEVRARLSARQKKLCEDPAYRKRIGDRMRGKPSPWKGRRPSDEARAKMSAAAKRRPPPMAGRRHTPESLLKMSRSKRGSPSPNKGKRSKFRGVPRTPEVKAKIAAGNIAFGHKMTAEHKANLLAINLGRPGPYKGTSRPAWVGARIAAGLAAKRLATTTQAQSG